MKKYLNNCKYFKDDISTVLADSNTHRLWEITKKVTLDSLLMTTNIFVGIVTYSHALKHLQSFNHDLFFACGAGILFACAIVYVDLVISGYEKMFDITKE